MDFRELPSWLSGKAGHLRELQRRGQLPHALLIHGPVGTGREQLALWLAGQVLGAPDLARVPVDSEEEGAALLHPDLLRLAPPADKRILPIDQVRDMVAFLQLTAHQGGAKIAIVRPAEALSHQAANSLLKTLEEPPVGSLIVLIAVAPARLPATVVSRCQHVRIPIPPVGESVQWLEAMDPDTDWAAALELAGGAPLRALDLAAAGFPAEARRLAADLESLQARRSNPVAVARRWAKLSVSDCSDWLYRRTAAEIRRLVEPVPDPRTGHLQYVTNGLNIEPLFLYLHEIAEFRRLVGSGLNMEIGFANLLERWYGGLRRT
ncbi:MAG: hypothetical protein QNJ73_16315 [Gammaproteobacteria bacterium]|nr:hypothetical protein [Gammaproteobacteria bacterium]